MNACCRRWQHWAEVGRRAQSALLLLFLLFVPVSTSASTALSALSVTTPSVVCLCAAWCRTCDAYREVFESSAAQHADMQFVWLDIEEHAELLGDWDIETFPTLLLHDGQQVCFCGPLPPQAGVLARLLTHFPTPASSTAIPAEAQALWARIRAGQSA